jgi:hypothetical protein
MGALVKDIIGTRFGRLVVLARADNIPTHRRGSGRTAWRCICDCGKETIVATESLNPNRVHGRTRSCGCLRKEICREASKRRRITDPVLLEESRQKRNRNQYIRYLKDKYGMTMEQYEEMASLQGWKCAICGRNKDTRLHVDHCHKTGKVRRLLCNSCNNALGLLQDDPEIILRAAEYVKEWREKNELL